MIMSTATQEKWQLIYLSSLRRKKLRATESASKFLLHIETTTFEAYTND